MNDLFESIDLLLLLRVLLALVALGVLGMIVLYIMSRVQPGIMADDARAKKWKRTFRASLATAVISALVMWKQIYRYDERTIVLQDNDLFNAIFYYSNNKLTLDPFFLMYVFASLIAAGAIGMIVLLIKRKVKPEIMKDNTLAKRWKRAFVICAALVVIPLLLVW